MTIDPNDVDMQALVDELLMSPGKSFFAMRGTEEGTVLLARIFPDKSVSIIGEYATPQEAVEVARAVTECELAHTPVH